MACNQEDLCAGQCNQHWFNTNWSSLISAGAGTFGFFDPERSLNSGQVLREALLTGHDTPSSMSLSSYMQDVAGLLEAVGAFQTVGVSTTGVTASPTQTVTTSSSAIKVPVEQILGRRLFRFLVHVLLDQKRERPKSDSKFVSCIAALPLPKGEPFIFGIFFFCVFVFFLGGFLF